MLEIVCHLFTDGSRWNDASTWFDIISSSQFNFSWCWSCGCAWKNLSKIGTKDQVLKSNTDIQLHTFNPGLGLIVVIFKEILFIWKLFYFCFTRIPGEDITVTSIISVFTVLSITMPGGDYDELHLPTFRPFTRLVKQLYSIILTLMVTMVFLGTSWQL